MADKKWSELWKGEYNASTQYEVSDTVSYNGSTYTCILYPPVGTAPTNTTYWTLVAQKGDTGPQGPQGPQGVQGPQGPQGDAGVSAGLLYAFNTDTTDSDPGNGQLKFNNATISSVTQIFIDNLENGGGNVSSFIDTWDDSTDPNVKGTIKITKRGAENNFAVFNITGSVVNGTGYRKVTVSHVSSSGSFSASDILSVLFSRTGNKGTDGTGVGDVVGPSSATNNNFAAFDGTTGKLIKDSGASASSFEPAGAVSTHASSTSTHGVSGSIVGTDNTQTLTNKTLTSPTINGSVGGTFGTGWNEAGETWTYASPTTFTVSGDVTAKYQKGTRIKLTQTTVKYFVVINSSHAGGTTTVTITGGTDYTLANAAITANYYSYQANPQGYPTWFNYTPTLSAVSPMTYTSVTVSLARFSVNGRQATVLLYFDGTTGGTASYGLVSTLPIPSASFTGTGCLARNGSAYASAYAYIGGASGSGAGSIEVRKADGGNWGLSPFTGCQLSFSYEI